VACAFSVFTRLAMSSAPEGTRLNKFLASSGIGSRRGCDALIQEGRVIINGEPCLNPGTRVTERDFVKVDGKRIQARVFTTIVFNKPRGLVCSKQDELHRDTIYSILPPTLQHLNHVGRLDMDSEGILILTNDGELAQSLAHPSKKIEKEYVVTVNQAFTNQLLEQLVTGIYTPDGKMSAKSVRRTSARRMRIVLVQGKKRQIRVMLEALGFKVTKLLRLRIGSFIDTEIEPGKFRLLEPDEVPLLLTNPVAAKKTRPRGERRPPPRGPRKK
jgi:23S rRNA pseudouridine2605 synthase